jgi:hypothetical protein
MLKKVLFISLLSIAIMKVYAQNGGYVQYVPNPSPPPPQQYTPPQQNTYQPPQQNYEQQAPAQPQYQLLYGYIIKSSGIRKVNLKVTYVDKSVYIIGVKELSSDYWTDITTTGATGQRLMYNEDYSDKFEYKVYIPILGEVVYF